MSSIKRPRDSFTANAPAPSSALPGKRVKFGGKDVADIGAGEGGEEDDLETKTKKGGVVQSGYDSDSSDEGSDAGGDEKKEGKEGEEEEEDMFGDGPPKEEKKAKPKEFLEMADIEGQEFGKGDDEDDDEDDEEDYLPEDDLANDDDAPRTSRSKKSMGYKMSGFNMAEELAEGRFSTDGSYVANDADPLASHDSWLSGVSKASIRAARQSKKRMEEEDRRRREKEDKGEEQLAGERDDCLIGILGIVREGESVAKALARLGEKKKNEEKGKERVKVVVKRAARKDEEEGMDVDGEEAPTSTRVGGSTTTEKSATAKKIDLLTHFASTLLSDHGELEIYEQTYEGIIDTLKKEGAVRRDWVPPRDPDLELEEQEERRVEAESRGKSSLIARPSASSGEKFWYKWSNPNPGQEGEFGPYQKGELEGWVAGGYFGADGANVVVRKEDGKWLSWVDARV
ncbi:GYF domain containing protein [Pseudohyphozyma bogoriensis]|nr:GYF domain containing protein [Pseudohyphozyma bogoriensis]